MPEQVKLKAADIVELLAARYTTPKNGFVPATLMPEVSIHTEGGLVRADAIVVGFTQAQGRVMEGFEIKVSRADWLHELKNPTKSEVWASNCMRWWIVAPRDIIKPGELPEAWGHMAPNANGTGLRVVKQAPLRAVSPSWEASIAFIARCNTTSMETRKLRAQVKTLEETQVLHLEELSRLRQGRLAEESDASLLKEVRRVEAEFGVKFDEFRSVRFGRANVMQPADFVRALVALEDLSETRREINQARHAAAAMNEGATAIEAAAKKVEEALGERGAVTLRA